MPAYSYQVTIDHVSVLPFLRWADPLLPLSVIKRALKDKQLKRAGQALTPESQLTAGDEIRLYTSWCRPDIPVLFEDEDVLVIVKPASLSVEEARGDSPLIRALKNQFNLPADLYLVHRLDSLTEGLMVLAKTARAKEILDDAFKGHDLVTKQYHCLVKGVPEPRTAVCQAFLTKDARRGEVVVSQRPSANAKPITTAYQVLRAGNPSLLLVTLHTGRTHQIRAHMAQLGHPLLGDDKYGDWAWNKAQGAKRLMLSADVLAFAPTIRIAGLAGKRFTHPPFFAPDLTEEHHVYEPHSPD